MDIKNLFIIQNSTPVYINILRTIGNNISDIYEIDLYRYEIVSENINNSIYKFKFSEYKFNTNIKFFVLKKDFLTQNEYDQIKTIIDQNIPSGWYFNSGYSPGGFLVYLNGEEYLIYVNTSGSLYAYNKILNILNYFRNILPNSIFDFSPVTIFEYFKSNANVSYVQNYTNNNMFVYYTNNIHVKKFLYKKYYGTESVDNNKQFQIFTNQSSVSIENNLLEIINPITKDIEFYNLLDSTFINNIGNGGDYYYLDLAGFDLSTSYPIWICIGKEYTIGQTIFQDIKYLLGGNICINNSDLLVPKSYSYETLETITIVNPPINNSEYNYGKNFIKVHQHIYGLNYSWDKWYIPSGNNKIIEYKNIRIPILLYSNNIIFDLEFSSKLFNTNNISDTTKLFDLYFKKFDNINSSYLSAIGIKYNNIYSYITDYKYNIYLDSTLYSSFMPLYKNLSLLLSEYGRFMLSNLYESLLRAFDYNNGFTITSVDLSNYENVTDIGILNILSPDYTIYQPCEHEIQLYLDGTNTFDDKENYIYLAMGQKWNNLSTLFEYNTDMIYFKFKDDTNEYSAMDALAKICSDTTSNYAYILFFIPNHLLKSKMKFYTFDFNLWLVRNWYLLTSKFGNTSMCNIVNLYLNKYLMNNDLPVVYKQDNLNKSLDIIYPYVDNLTLNIFDSTSYIAKEIKIDPRIFFNSKYWFIPDSTGIDLYIINEYKYNMLQTLLNRVKSLEYPIYFSDFSQFGYNYIYVNIPLRVINVMKEN